MKTRISTECNYKGIWLNGKTLRIALDPTKPIAELKHPEFFDVKLTSQCEGNCSYCYQNSLNNLKHTSGIAERFTSFFGRFNNNQKPFQIAFGGGEPTSHPEFERVIKACHDLDIVANYTTNGMWVNKPYADKILEVTQKYCGGVAVSTHPHLDKYWREAVNKYLATNTHTNLHVIIGNRQSIDTFSNIYEEYKGRVKYFVLLPLSAQGRSTDVFSDWDYLSSKIDGSPADVAFGANFYPYLTKDKGRFNVSLYEPESMSAYLDLETMKVFKSSFSIEERIITI